MEGRKIEEKEAGRKERWETKESQGNEEDEGRRGRKEGRGEGQPDLNVVSE